MIVTEEEAKTKRCCGPEGCGSIGRFAPPQPVPTGVLGVGYSINGPQLLYSMCIGSACMAWRWFGVVSTMLVDVNLPPPKHGYCGYARHG